MSEVSIQVFGGVVDRLADGYLADFLAEDADCRAADQVVLELRSIGFTEETISLARRSACVEAVSRLATFNSELKEMTTHDA